MSRFIGNLTGPDKITEDIKEVLGHVARVSSTTNNRVTVYLAPPQKKSVLSCSFALREIKNNIFKIFNLTAVYTVYNL